MEEIPFDAITPEAETILDRVLKRKILTESIKKKLVCACLGPGEHGDLYDIRVKYKNFIREKGHVPFFPEDIGGEEVSRMLDRMGVEGTSKEALLGDKNLLNEVLITQSDMVFNLCVSSGPSIELGKYARTIAHKIWVLVPEDMFHSKSQLGLEIETLQKRNPHCLVTFDNEEDLLKKVEYCLVLEIRKQIGRDIHE